MKFLKNNSYDIVRLFINQMGITIFSLVLYVSVGFVEDEALRSSLQLVVSIGATLFYFALLYCAAWEYGAKDKIRIEGGKEKKVFAKGALMSLVANSLNIILGVAAAICMAVYISNPSFQTEESALGNAFALLNMFMRFISAMFIGIVALVKNFSADQLVINLYETLGYIVMFFVTVGVTQLGYFLGSKNIRIFSVFSPNGENR